MCLACAVLLPLAAFAQADPLRVELARCATITEVPSRVACYDALARPTESRSPGKAPEPVSSESFGQPKRKPEPSEKRDESLLAKVTDVREVQPNKLQITLANGQVWQQTVGKAFLIRANDTVRIASSGWGRSFRLEVDGHPGYIQVSRLQ